MLPTCRKLSVRPSIADAWWSKQPARSCVLVTVLFSACCRISTIEAETDLENGKPSAQKSEPTLTLKGTFTRTQPASKSFNALSSPMVESNLPSCGSSVHFIHVQYTYLQSCTHGRSRRCSFRSVSHDPACEMTMASSFPWLKDMCGKEKTLWKFSGKRLA